MKFAFQTSTSSSIRRSTSPTEGGSCVHASQLRVSCRFAPRPCHVRPSLRRRWFRDVYNHALADDVPPSLDAASWPDEAPSSSLDEVPPVVGRGAVAKAHATTSADAASTTPATRGREEVTRTAQRRDPDSSER